MWKASIWAFSGALLGVAVSQIASHASAKATPQSATSAAVPASTSESQQANSDLQRQINALRTDLNARQQVAAPAPSAQPVASAAPEPEPLEPLELHKQSLADYAHEGVDPVWAPQTEKSIAADLTKSGSGGVFDVKSVTCHTTSCVASLEFPTFEAARRGWRRVLATNLESRCGTEVVLDPAPRDPSQRFGTQVVFNCEGVRAGD